LSDDGLVVRHHGSDPRRPVVADLPRPRLARAVAPGQQARAVAAGVDGHRVDSLRVEIRTLVELPLVPAPAPDEQAFSCAYGEQYLGHADHLRDVSVPDTGQSAPHH